MLIYSSMYFNSYTNIIVVLLLLLLLYTDTENYEIQ